MAVVYGPKAATKERQTDENNGQYLSGEGSHRAGSVQARVGPSQTRLPNTTQTVWRGRPRPRLVFSKCVARAPSPASSILKVCGAGALARISGYPLSCIPPLISGTLIVSMLDLGFVRDNLPLVEDKLRQRGISPDVLKDFKQVDTERRQVITESETLKARRNRASEDIAKLKKAGQDASAQI